MIYSKNNQYPAPLPSRIILSDGTSRTNPSTFTTEEIADAGYIAITQPNYNPTTEQLEWDGTQFHVVLIPPPIPQPDWVNFNKQIFTNIRFNQVLGASINYVPTAALSIATAVDQITRLGTDLFKDIYPTIIHYGGATQEDRNVWRQIAKDNNLPQEFIDIL